MLLKDKVAVITGGGGGLGEGIALCMAKEGANIVVSDLNQELAEKTAAKIKGMGQKSLAISTDVTKKDQCRKLISESLKGMGNIDILVCGAGVGGFTHRPDSDEPLILENISEKDWNTTIDVNLKGTFLCIQAIAAHFRKQKSGKIINVSSIGGRNGLDWVPHYSASKAGVIVLSQGIAVQLAPFGINVNTICPGVIRTPMWDAGAKVLGQAYPPFKGLNPDQVFQGIVENIIPMKRPQTAEDIGQTAVFLASENAREITGQAINVDGGACFN